MVQVLNIIGIATKEIKQGRMSKRFLYKEVPAEKAIFNRIFKETDGKERY